MLLSTVPAHPASPRFLLAIVAVVAVVAVALWSIYQPGRQLPDDPAREAPQRIRYESGAPNSLAVAAASWVTGGSPLLVDSSWDDLDLVVLDEQGNDIASRLSAVHASIVTRRGRIAVIRPARVPTYHPELFGAAFRRSALLAEPEDSPMWKRLGRALREEFASSRPLSHTSRVALAGHFNALLDDRGLFVSLSKFYDARTSTASEIMSVIPVRWQPLAQWIHHQYDHRGIFDPEGPELDALDLEALRRFNAICLSMWFSGQDPPVLGTLFPNPPGTLEGAAKQSGLRIGPTFPVAPGLEIVVLELQDTPGD